MTAPFDKAAIRALAAIAIAIAVGVMVGRPATDRGAHVVRAPVIEIAPDDPLLTVHVSGEVMSPGLIEVDGSARVADAILAAGGVTSTADLGAINLAGALADGDHVVVPPANRAGVVTSTDSGDERVKLNSASASDLEELSGVGPVLAERIVEHRDEFGPFGVIEDLLGVSGIGERTLASIRDDVIVP